jgi:hypothetical protein
MRKLILPLATAGAGLVLVLLVAGAVGAEEAGECQASLEPARVPARASPVTVNARLSEPIDEIEDVAVEDGSGPEVRSVAPTGGPDDVAIVLDTSGAAPGEWTLTIDGPETDCRGSLTVEEGPLAAAGSR